jgi:hypothetical protein
MNLLNENPKEFIFLVLIIAGVLFLFGVPLKSLRSYSRGLQGSIGRW